MFSFYTIVVIIAVILLIISLTVVGVTLKSNKNVKPFPDYQNTCPDFWTLDVSGNSCIPQGINVPYASSVNDAAKHAGVYKNANSTEITSINISDDNWVGLCDKAAWAKKYNILWDGVTNSNTCSR